VVEEVEEVGLGALLLDMHKDLEAIAGATNPRGTAAGIDGDSVWAQVCVFIHQKQLA